MSTNNCDAASGTLMDCEGAGNKHGCREAGAMQTCGPDIDYLVQCDKNADNACSSNGSLTAATGRVRRNVALITGVNGQDGSYLAEFLLSKGYEVHGIMRKLSEHKTHRIKHLRLRIAKESPEVDEENMETDTSPEFQEQSMEGNCLTIHYADMTNTDRLVEILTTVQPTEVYNLAGSSDAVESFELTEYSANVNGLGAMRLLDAIRQCSLGETVRFCQASTGAMFGNYVGEKHNEETPFFPRSPFAISKVFAHWIVRVYREEFGMQAGSSILFNHESPRRGEKFVTRKITQAVARISCGLQEFLELGNINTKRDWGHARDYVEAMWLMLQQEKADDYTICTGVTHSVREFVELAFQQIGVDIVWEGEGVDEIGRDKKTSVIRVKINPIYFRPIEISTLLGDNTKAEKVLGWKPKCTLENIVEEMVQYDLKSIKEKNLNNNNN